MMTGAVESDYNLMFVNGFAAMKALCTDSNDKPEEASRPFDATRAGFVLGEGAAMGAFGLLLGLFGGLGLAALLILVINRTWFGWTIRPAWPGPELAGQALVVMAVAARAAMYPASRARLAQPGQLTRDDL